MGTPTGVPLRWQQGFRSLDTRCGDYWTAQMMRSQAIDTPSCGAMT
jgi:hypothetical protein